MREYADVQMSISVDKFARQYLCTSCIFANRI